MILPIQGEDIQKLIPQRPPMVMLDAFYGLEGEVSASGLNVREENLFCRDGHLLESGLIEHIAQSAAARVGYICLQSGQPIPLGFIGSVDKLSIYALPKLGDTLRTEISVVQELMNISLVGAEVRVGDTLVADCKMKIVLNP